MLVVVDVAIVVGRCSVVVVASIVVLVVVVIVFVGLALVTAIA